MVMKYRFENCETIAIIQHGNRLIKIWITSFFFLLFFSDLQIVVAQPGQIEKRDELISNRSGDDIFDITEIFLEYRFSFEWSESFFRNFAISGQMLDGQILKRLEIYNPKLNLYNDQFIFDGENYSSSIKFIKEPQEVLIPGVYTIQITAESGQIGIYKLSLVETDFSHSLPVILSPAPNSIINSLETIEWEPFISDERRISDPDFLMKKSVI